ncbi:hypothetical protein E2C01_074116 [Portunus trituberculatus]|uniref:Uncharacterized protein n=1 Tax=Portunus trituberculatus TaxID=210409 RepID=A0A5B7I2J5_PORTR|nr:hypothetical protein [Portunus trituberculatus]
MGQRARPISHQGPAGAPWTPVMAGVPAAKDEVRSFVMELTVLPRSGLLWTQRKKLNGKDSRPPKPLFPGSSPPHLASSLSSG